MRPSFVLSHSWPSLFSPHAKIIPSLLNAMLWAVPGSPVNEFSGIPPAEIAITETPGGVDGPGPPTEMLTSPPAPQEVRRENANRIRRDLRPLRIGLCSILIHA